MLVCFLCSIAGGLDAFLKFEAVCFCFVWMWLVVWVSLFWLCFGFCLVVGLGFLVLLEVG